MIRLYASDAIKIEGLAEFSRNLRKLGSDLPKGLRLAANESANIVVDAAKPEVPKLTGGAAGTLKAKSTRTEARVQGGSNARPYYPWLDFGGSVGIRNSVKRPFLKEGRYIYPAFKQNKDSVHKTLLEQLVKVAESAGLPVDGA